MEHSEVSSQDRNLDLEVIGAAAADVCILLTGMRMAALNMARRIHSLGRGRAGRFRVVNCGWPESLVEEQLFQAIRPGSSGTVFLEDVDRLSPVLQDRLIEAMDGPIDPRGPCPPRARVMACTSEPLIQWALEGSFNERLLYRLNAIHLIVPPDDSDW